MLQGGQRIFFSAARFFISPPRSIQIFRTPPSNQPKNEYPPPSPLTRNIKINICIIVRDMFNKDIERALTVYDNDEDDNDEDNNVAGDKAAADDDIDNDVGD